MSDWPVLDLFSGAGGMSYGFHARPPFRVVGAVDVEFGKPSSGAGALECNRTYEANIGVAPLALDLATAEPSDIRDGYAGRLPIEMAVLSSCAPCTGFSRAKNVNHLRDDPGNSLVGRSLLFVDDFRPTIFLMENARELLQGTFRHHWDRLRRGLAQRGYEVVGAVHRLDRFGLPQVRERAIITAVRDGLTLRTFDDLWDGYELRSEVVTVRRAIAELPRLSAGCVDRADPMHASPAMGPDNLRRIRLIPNDGGSWADLRHHPDRESVLTGAMLRNIARQDFGSHPDVYGRLTWDKPAPTIKRECGHIGNGRYAHPEQDRLCTVRELAILQGFPRTYQFRAKALSNNYRHVGDAVPPLVSYQLSALCEWMLTGRKPELPEWVLPGTHLRHSDIRASKEARSLFAG